MQQGCFACAIRITFGRKVLVFKIVEITDASYKWVMRETLFGYHLAKLAHPNIARLLHHYFSPNSVPTKDDYAGRSCIQFIQDDCGSSIYQ